MRTTRRNFFNLSLISFVLALVLAFGLPQVVGAGTITVDPGGGGDYLTIEDAITNALVDDTIEVVPGTYVENLEINKNLTLTSTGSRTDTTIQGTSDGSLGTILLTSGTTSVTIEGFTILGIDNPSDGIESAAIYLQDGHSGTEILNNEIVANGDAGLLGEWSATYDSITITNNIFSGQTFIGPEPGGCGFLSQFTTPDVPRQLVTFGNGGGDEATANATNITFTNNQITGTAGGTSTVAGCEDSGQGNTLVTLDAANSTITGNTFSGTTALWATSLRVRRPGTTITGNTFSSAGLLSPLNGHFFFQNALPTFTSSSFAASNTFDRGVYIDSTASTGGLGITIQSVVDAASPGDTVVVLAATYEEQVIIDKDLTLQGAGRDTATIQATDTMTSCYTTTYDHYGVICALDADITIDGFTVDGAGKGNTNNRFLGVDYHNAGGALSNCTVTGIREEPFSGNPHGIAIYAYNESGSPVTLTVQSNIVTDFQKNAMALNTADGSPLNVWVESNIITGTGATDVLAQNGIQTFGIDVSGIITNNQLSGIGYSVAGPVATTILNYYADVQILNNTMSNVHLGIYNIDGPAIISDNTMDIEKIGTAGYGIIATDPPDAVPAPYIETAIPSSEPALSILGVGDPTLVVEVIDNEISFSGADSSYTYGVIAKAGYSAFNTEYTATGNIVSGFDYGMELSNCTDSCNTGEFTSVEMHLNDLSGNTTALSSNFPELSPADAVINWYGDASGPSGEGPGSGAAITTGLIFAPWCATADCSEIYVPAGTSVEDIQTALDWAPEGATLTFAPSTFDGGYVINTAGLTLDLQESTIGAGSPAFTINAPDTTILNGILDGAGDASPGVLVQAAGDNPILDDLEILNWADGIEIDTNADIDSFKVVNCWIHDNADAGLQLNSGVVLTGNITIKGNLFKENGGMGVQDDSQISTLDVTYNSWGHINGPVTGDGVAGNVNAIPYTFSEVWVDVDPNAEATSREVKKMETFDVAVKVDAANLYAASYKLTYDTNFLSLNSATDGDFAPTGVGLCLTDTSVPGVVDVDCTRMDPASEANGTLTITTLSFTADLSGVPDDATTWSTLFDLSVDKADLASGAKEGVKVFVNNGGFGTPSGLTGRTITDTNDGEINIITIDDISGYIDLQARLDDGGATLKIYNGSDVASAIQYAIATSDSSGAYAATILDSYNIIGGMTYYVVVDAYLFLPTTPVDAATFADSFLPTTADPITLNTFLLLGGDATDDKTIDINDISCIATDYGSILSTCSRGSSDVNNDGIINLLDLVLAGGNYGKTSSNVTLAAPADTTADATITLSPSTGTYNFGNTFTVEVWVNDVTDLYGMEVFLSFDPTILQVQDADSGTSGVQVQPLDGFLSPDQVALNNADNTAGTIEFVVTQINPIPPVSGSGAVLEIEMRGGGGGDTSLEFTDFMLVAWDGGSSGPVEILTTATSGTYTVENAEVFMPISMYNATTEGATAYLPLILKP